MASPEPDEATEEVFMFLVYTQAGFSYKAQSVYSFSILMAYNNGG